MSPLSREERSARPGASLPASQHWNLSHPAKSFSLGEEQIETNRDIHSDTFLSFFLSREIHDSDLAGLFAAIELKKTPLYRRILSRHQSASPPALGREVESEVGRREAPAETLQSPSVSQAEGQEAAQPEVPATSRVKPGQRQSLLQRFQWGLSPTHSPAQEEEILLQAQPEPQPQLQP